MSMVASRAGLFILVGLLVLWTGVTLPFPSPSTRASIGPSVQPGGFVSSDLPRLGPGQSLERSLASIEAHLFRISLSAGDYLDVKVDQQGIDAVVTLLDPERRVLILMDSPNGRTGEEPVLAIAEKSGEHFLKVSALPQGGRGSYRLVIQELRPATAVDRQRAAALRGLALADGLKNQRPMLAIEEYQAALGTSASIADAPGQTRALTRLGLLYGSQDRRQEALVSFVQAQSLARALGDPSTEADLLNHAGLMRRDLGELDEARESFRRALTIAEGTGDLEGQARAYNNLARISKLRGRAQEALTSYRTSLMLFRRTNEPAQEAQTLSSLGELLLDMGKPAAALSAFNEAISRLRQEESREVRFAILNGAGMAYHELGLRKRGLWFYRLALGIARSPKERALTLGRLGAVYRDEGNLAQGSAVLQEALRLARSQGDRWLEAYILADLAHLENLRGRDVEAFGRFEQALTLFEELRDPVGTARVLFGRAQTERDLGHLEKAVASVEKSIHLIESMRADLVDSEMRVSFFASRHRNYELYIDLLMEMSRRMPGAEYETRAFEATERFRARSLLDEISGSRTTEVMTLHEIQREVVDENSLLLTYLLGERRSFLWAVTHDSIATFTLPSRDAIEETVLRAQRQLTAGSGETEVETLSKMLLPTEIGPLGRKRLLVSPDGPLHLFPFVALYGPGSRPLILDHEIVNLPSASFLGVLRRTVGLRQPAPRQIAVLADPVFGDDDPRIHRLHEYSGTAEEIIDQDLASKPLKRLSFSRREAKEILSLVPEEERLEALDFDANRSTALSPAIRQYRILHFATHNLIEGHPELSGLVLSRFDRHGRPIRGFLRAPEIYNLDLPVELVVLSACGTGLGREVRGEGVVGLARAFLHSGARRVMVTLWDVQEGATTELMSRFYRGMLQDGLPPAAALRNAQVSMAEDRRWRSPQYWAGFMLQGEPL